MSRTAAPGARRDPRQTGWTGLLLPLVPVYAAGLAVKNAAYDLRWIRPRRLAAPVISVGNLSVGGAGKTPLVIRLAGLLAARGVDVDVLSRGYGRQSRAVEQVQLDLEGAAERFGDEPVLIAQATGVPVYVGASRYAAGLLAEERPATGPRLHLLDDGFQHRQLGRAVDIVVLHRSDFSARLLPAGRLRESLASLRRASIAVLRVEDAAFEPELRRRFPRLAVWRMVREIALDQPFSSADQPQPGVKSSGANQASSAVAFCGIAHPEEFFAALTGSGAVLAAQHSFGDHHPYTDADIARLRASLVATGARRLLTTAKDLVRLSPAHRRALEASATLEAVPLRARLLDEEAAIAQLLALAGLPLPGNG